MALTGFWQCISAINHIAILQWFFAILVALFDMMAFSTLLTLFSNAVDEESQGWVMGISGAVMAIAWVLTGLSSSLLSFISTDTLIFSGGVFLLFSSLLLSLYKQCRSS